MIIFEESNRRINREALHIRTAGLYSLRATCGRLQVGAVAVRDGRVIACSHNGPLKGEPHCTSLTCDQSKPCTRAVHAEANLISFCAKEGIPLSGTDLYCTHQPCEKCAELIIATGFSRVYFQHSYRLDDGLQRLLNNNIQVIRIDEQGNPQQI